MYSGGGYDILDFFLARVYAKSFLVLLTYLAGKLTERIALRCGLDEEKADRCFYLFASSAVVFSSVSVCGQNDIIGLVFCLLAFLTYLENKTVRFYICFFFALQCKLFALFIFIPLILLKEKKIIKILLKIGIPICIMKMINIPFQLADPVGVAHKSAPADIVIEELLRMKMGFMGLDLSCIFLLFGGVCMLAYLFRLDSYEKYMERNIWKDIIMRRELVYVYFAYLGLAAMLLLFSSPYRMIYLIPFMVILLVSKKGNFNLRFILFHATMISLIFGYIKEFYWCYDFTFMHNMLADLIIPFHKFELLGVEQLFLRILGDDPYGIWTIFYSVFVVYAAGFAYIHFSGRKESDFLKAFLFSEENADKKPDEPMNSKGMERRYWISLFANYFVVNIAVILLFVSVLRNIINKIF